MNPLTSSQLRDITKQLKQRKAELQLEVPDASAVAERQELAERAAMADDQAQLAVDDAQVERDLGELREIEAALRRIAEGGYGTCVACGDEIGLARLQAEPSAARCIACQRDRERKHG